ncbi:CHAT domain-containing protein [Silvibacterium sp.]|uniref:CHAT domain-containing protein n=1 Tax=Silvibacterium sp. TaxID=1964179 RepID=UPI0039E4F37C
MKPSPGPSDDKTAERLSRLLDELPGGEPPQWSAIGRDSFGPDCPDESTWEKYIAGRLDKPSSAVLLLHASECRGCGARLLFWSDVLSDGEVQGERGALEELRCIEPEWQAAVAQQMHESHTRQGGRILLWSSVLGVAGAIAAGALLFLFLGNQSLKSPERLLAEAYTTDRTMELRIPLAGYAAVSGPERTRGAGEAGHEAVPLLEARAAITQALMKSPEDPKWLLLEARADLLNENYDSAIDTLRRLEVQSSDDVAVLTDLATAYQERAVATDTSTDRAAALDAIEHAAKLAPNDPVVLYNEGLLLEQVYQYLAAVDAWKKYLAVERDPEWHADGQRHLDAVTARLARENAKQSELAPYMATPEGMLHLARSPDLLAAHDEELSTTHLPHLLQAAFPISPPTSESTENCDAGCSAARSLLSAIAASLESRHHDRWLIDLLAASNKPGFPAAAGLLGTAMTDGTHTLFSEALHGASEAQRSFTTLGDQAGALRAGLEVVFDDEHLLDDRNCLKEAATLTGVSTGRPYPWMAAQFWADESSCHLQQNDFATVNASLTRSLHISDEAGYGIVHLRALGFLASNEESQGNRAQAWKMSLEGLRTYWNGDYPAIRKLQFYGNMVYAEGASDRVYGAALLHREATRMLVPMDLPEVLAANQLLLAKAEVRDGELAASKEDWRRGVAFFSSGQDHDKVVRSNVNMSSMMADAYLASGDMLDAEQVVASAGKGADLAGNRDVELRYALVQGKLDLVEHHEQDAARNLSRALALAEEGAKAATSRQEREDWVERVRPVYASMVQLELHEGRPAMEALAAWERYRLLSVAPDMRPWCGQDPGIACLVPALENIRKRLGAGIVLGAIRLDRSLLLWKMDSDGVRFQEVELDSARFDLLCHAFADTVASPTSAESGIHELGASLATHLFGPFVDDLAKAHEVVFDLDDSMDYLPVNALPWRGSYLGLEMPVEEVRALLAGSGVSRATEGEKSLVIGASMPARENLARLPEARTEAVAVAATLPGATVLTGRGATPEAMEQALSGSVMVHFAGHAAVKDSATKLMLAAERHDTAGELDVRNIPPHALAACRLFVLSACATGSREDRDVGGAADIEQTLSADGVKQTVAAHWAVDSAASVPLMKAFYGELAAGKSVSTALMESERELSAQSGYHHPYFWASYSVFGMSRENLKELFR